MEKNMELDCFTNHIFSTAKYLPKSTNHLCNYPEYG